MVQVAQGALALNSSRLGRELIFWEMHRSVALIYSSMMFVGVVLLIDASRNGVEIMDLLQKSI